MMGHLTHLPLVPLRKYRSPPSCLGYVLLICTSCEENQEMIQAVEWHILEPFAWVHCTGSPT